MILAGLRRSVSDPDPIRQLAHQVGIAVGWNDDRRGARPRAGRSDLHLVIAHKIVELAAEVVDVRPETLGVCEIPKYNPQ